MLPVCYVWHLPAKVFLPPEAGQAAKSAFVRTQQSVKVLQCRFFWDTIHLATGVGHAHSGKAMGSEIRKKVRSAVFGGVIRQANAVAF